MGVCIYTTDIHVSSPDIPHWPERFACHRVDFTLPLTCPLKMEMSKRSFFFIRFLKVWSSTGSQVSKQSIISCHNGATFCPCILAARTRIFFILQYKNILRRCTDTNLPEAVFLSVLDRSLRFSLMGISTQHALHLGRPPFVAVKSSFSAC